MKRDEIKLQEISYSLSWAVRGDVRPPLPTVHLKRTKKMAQGPSFQSFICTNVMKLPRVAAFPLIMEVAERDSRTTSSENHPPSLTVTSADTGPSQQCFTYSCWLPGTTCVVSDCRIEEEIFLSQRHGHTGPQTERCSVKHMVF